MAKKAGGKKGKKDEAVEPEHDKRWERVLPSGLNAPAVATATLSGSQDTNGSGSACSSVQSVRVALQGPGQLADWRELL